MNEMNSCEVSWDWLRSNEMEFDWIKWYDIRLGNTYVIDCIRSDEFRIESGEIV